MAKAKNMVVSGDYLNKPIMLLKDNLVLLVGFVKQYPLNKDTIEEYEVIDEEKSKSTSSTILRAGVGSALLGPLGLLAGVGAKQKGIYNIAIIFKDGKKSLIEVDEKIYNKLMKVMF